MSIPFDDSQRAFIESDAQNIRLLAPAGSGKTLSLLERCRWLYEHKKGAERPRFLIVTFTRAARDELRDRVNTDSRFSIAKSFIKIHTLNQWGYNYLKSNQSKLSLKTSENDKWGLVNNVLRPIWIDNPLLSTVLEKSKDRLDVIDIINDLKSLGFQHNLNLSTHFSAHIDWLKQNGLGRYFDAIIAEKLKKLGLINSHGKSFFDQSSSFIEFWNQACEHLWKSAIISLEDQKYWALLLLQQRYKGTLFPEISRYHHIMIDEFQDINPLDLHLIKQLSKVNKATLTIAGDDDQAIFEWRGSSPNFILNPSDYFGSTFSTYLLSKNYRSPKNIVLLSQNLISYNKNREKKGFPACANQNDAEIVHQTFDTHIDSLDFVIKLAIDANQLGKPKQLAIVSRKKSQIIPIQILLASQNIPYYAKEDLNILLSNAFDDLKKILHIIPRLALQRDSSDVIDDFIKCCNYVSWYPLNKTARDSVRRFLLEKRPHTFLKAIDEFQGYKGKLFLKNNEYIDAIKNVTHSSTVSKSITQVGYYLKGMQKHYGKADDDIFYKDPPFFYLAEFARQYKSDFNGFIEQVEKVISINSKPYDEMSDEVDADLRYPVHIMTAPRTKGKEFETVVLLDVNDQIWPHKLNQEEDQLEQERRLFYVAVTRPRKKLVLLTVKSFGNEPAKPSPYISEMGLNGLNSKIIPITTKKTSQVLNRAEHNIPANPNLKEKKSKGSVPQSKPNVSNEQAKEIFGRVCKELKSSSGEWIDWDIFRSKLRELFPEFTVGGSQKLKFKSVVNTYSSLLEHRYHERFSNKVFVRVNGAEQVVKSKEKPNQSLKKRGSMSSVIKDPIVSTLQEISPDGKRVSLKKFREHLYRLYPSFDDNLRLYSFKLEDALLKCSGAIDFSRKNSTIGLKNK